METGNSWVSFCLYVLTYAVCDCSLSPLSSEVDMSLAGSACIFAQSLYCHNIFSYKYIVKKRLHKFVYFNSE